MILRTSNNLNMIYLLNSHYFYFLIFFYFLELTLMFTNKKFIIHIGYNSYHFLSHCFVWKISRSWSLYCSRIKVGLLIILFLNHYFIHFQIYFYFLFNLSYILNQLNSHLLNANYSCFVSIQDFNSWKKSPLDQIQSSNLTLKFNYLFVFNYHKQTLISSYQILSLLKYLPQKVASLIQIKTPLQYFLASFYPLH